MANMTKNWKPDPETAELFADYAAALRTERDLKPDVRERAKDALKDGATVTQLARLTGMTPEVFRRMARDLELPVDPRYAERAAASRRQPAASQSNERPATAASSAPGWLSDFPEIAVLTFAEARERAQKLELDRPHWFAENRRDCTAAPEWVNHAMLAADAADPEATAPIDTPATANPDRAQVD